MSQAPAPLPSGNVVDCTDHWEPTGVTIRIAPGLDVVVYHSMLDGVCVVEIETYTPSDGCGIVAHTDPDDVPEIRVLINEATIHNALEDE